MPKGGDRGAHGVGVTDVHADQHAVAVRGPDPLEDLPGGLFLRAVRDAHEGALRTERLGDRSAQPSRGAGDEHAHVPEALHERTSGGKSSSWRDA